MDQKKFNVSLELVENYLFKIDFGDFGTFMTDEPEPLGNSEGPGPSALLGASVANCLAASLLFAVRKFKEDPGEVTATCEGVIERVDGRWRIVALNVDIRLGALADSLGHIERVLEQFEDFCVVTQSVRNGIDVNVGVFDEGGKQIK